MENTNSKKIKTPNSIPYSRGIRINWGTGIVIAIALFMSFILYFVIKVQTNSKYDNELVVEEYYKHDAHFQEEIDRTQNAQNVTDKPIITTINEGITIVFPATYDLSKIKGKVSLYRPSGQKFDFEIPISLSTSHPTLLIPKLKLVGGRWDMNMEWQYDGVAYLTKETLYIK